MCACAYVNPPKKDDGSGWYGGILRGYRCGGSRENVGTAYCGVSIPLLYDACVDRASVRDTMKRL